MDRRIILEEKDGQTEFEVILAGTGIVESILSCALSRAGKKILHVDANRFYGANSGSLNLKQYNSYIAGKLHELTSFRSHAKICDKTPISLKQIKSLIHDKDNHNIQYVPISFLNSLTSPQNVFGNFEQIEFINSYKLRFKSFERNVLRNRYNIQFRIGYTFVMNDKNGLLIYKITNINKKANIYQCQRVFTKNKNQFPQTIYLSFDQLIHTKQYKNAPSPPNTNIFKLNDVLYYKCLNDVDAKNKEKTPKNDEKTAKIEEKTAQMDDNCVCKAVMDETQQIMFYDYENEIDSIIGATFECKKIRYECKKITNDHKILCQLASQNKMYDSNTKDILISFNMQQMRDFTWMKPHKYNTNSKNTETAVEWDQNITFNDDNDWDKLLHLRQVLHAYYGQYRKICIDFIPNLIYGIEGFIQVLVSSQVSSYVDFRGINKNFVYSDNLTVLKVPLSKSDVFNAPTKVLTYLEKRQLTKFMQSVLNDAIDAAEIENITFSEYMLSQQQKVSPKLLNFIRYALAFLDSAEEDPNAKDMLHRLRLFLKSIGRFSAGSFLYPMFGCGDLAPGFVRSSAVKGGVFILDWSPKAIVVQDMKYHNVCGKKGYLFEWQVDHQFYCVVDVAKYECLCVLDGSVRVFDGNALQNESVALIGRRFVFAEDCVYEIRSMRAMCDDFVMECALTPQISSNPNMHNVAKVVYLSLQQLMFVKWMHYTAGRENGEEHKSDKVDGDENVIRCTGIITAANQFVKTRYFVGGVDYFSNTIRKVTVKHYRMTVISDGPIAGTLFNKLQKEKNNDSESDDDDSDETEEKVEKKESVEERSHCCVVHIPPNTKPFDNIYSIHIIQLDHFSCTVPPPLCLTFFWCQCGGNNNAKVSLERCFDIFYRRQVIVDGNVEQRPLGLMRTIYEQRVREVNTDSFAENVHIVKDSNDTIGYENAVQAAKTLFKKMYPNDVWMEKDKKNEPQQSRADRVFGALQEEEKDKNIEEQEKPSTDNNDSPDKQNENENDKQLGGDVAK